MRLKVKSYAQTTLSPTSWQPPRCKFAAQRGRPVKLRRDSIFVVAATRRQRKGAAVQPRLQWKKQLANHLQRQVLSLRVFSRGCQLKRNFLKLQVFVLGILN